LQIKTFLEWFQQIDWVSFNFNFFFLIYFYTVNVHIINNINNFRKSQGPSVKLIQPNDIVYHGSALQTILSTLNNVITWKMQNMELIHVEGAFQHLSIQLFISICHSFFRNFLWHASHECTTIKHNVNQSKSFISDKLFISNQKI